MADLTVLNSRRPAGDSVEVPPLLQGVSTPLELAEWQEALGSHPNRSYVKYLLGGMKDGFRIGFNYSTSSHRSAKSNMLSATANREVTAILESLHCTSPMRAGCERPPMSIKSPI